MDVGPDEQTIWSVDTENRESNSWTDPLGTITQEWDLSPYCMKECKRERQLNSGAEQETKLWHGQVYTGIQQERSVVNSSYQF